MKRHEKHSPKRGAVLWPAVAIWAMAVSLAGVLELSGFLAAFDALVRDGFAALEEGTDFQEVPLRVVAAVSALLVFGIVWAMLDSPGTWRRLVLWASCLFLTMSAVPVAGMGGWCLKPGMPVVAVLWGGACALTYAARNRMPCEGDAPPH